MLRNFAKKRRARVDSCVLLLVFTFLVWAAPDVRAAEINVGPDRPLKTLHAGVTAAGPNDRVVLDSGVYVDDVVTIDKPLTIEGAGRGAILRITRPIPNRKGILVVNADLTVRKITFEGAFIVDADGRNGAGIRHQAGRLVVDTCVFNGNQNGILANPDKAATVTIRRSTFSGNGVGDGYTHGIYVNAIAQLTVSNSTFTGTKVGHNIKSRALKTVITDTVLDDGVNGTPSYAVDLPNGGEAVLKGLRITQGQRTSNTSMIAYGAEGSLHEKSSLTVTGSTFINSAQASTAVNNFSAVTAILSDNTFQNVGEIARGLVRMNEITRPSLKEGAVFSGADPNARSYFRFHNTGTTPGNVTVRLHDGRDGRLLGTWQSPNIAPDAAPQFSITTLESALGVELLPPTYSVTVEAAMTGTFQHVLYRAQSGVLTNLSTCTAGVMSVGAQIGAVHTSNLDSGYRAAILVQNLGATPAPVQIGLYNALQGDRVGLYTSPELPVDGELLVPVAVIEAGAQTVPAWDMGHWVLKIENEFTGSLQQLIANAGAAVFTDMSTVCNLNASNADRGSAIGIGAVFPAPPAVDSVLRFHNTGTATALAHVIFYDVVTGARIGRWETPPLAPNSSRQYAVSAIAPDMRDGGSRGYRLRIESGFAGFVRHLMWNGLAGALTNLSACDAGTTASLRDAASLRPSGLEGEDVSLLVIFNSGAAAANPSLDVFDASDGRALGRVTVAALPPAANITLTVADIEATLGIASNSGIGAFNVRLAEGFDGTMQHLSVSTRSGAVNDMTTACAVGPVNG